MEEYEEAIQVVVVLQDALDMLKAPGAWLAGRDNYALGGDGKVRYSLLGALSTACSRQGVAAVGALNVLYSVVPGHACLGDFNSQHGITQSQVLEVLDQAVTVAVDKALMAADERFAA